jgi:hypothetical protein
MRRVTITEFSLVALGVLALVQLMAMVLQATPAADSPAFGLQVGETAAGIQAKDSTGARISLANAQLTALLVFRSDCGHCRVAAPIWREWVRGNGQAFRVAAVTTDHFPLANRFPTEHGFEVDVLRVDPMPLGSRAHELTARTPWVFFLDREGVVLAQGHGAKINEIAADVLNPLDREE